MEADSRAHSPSQVGLGRVVQGGGGWSRLVWGGVGWCRVVQGGVEWCRGL